MEATKSKQAQRVSEGNDAHNAPMIMPSTGPLGLTFSDEAQPDWRVHSSPATQTRVNC